MISKDFEAPDPPVGVVESLSQGFELTAGHLLLLLLPVLFDLMLWIGPRVSYQPLIELTQNSFLEMWELNDQEEELTSAQQRLEEYISESLTAIQEEESTQYFSLVFLPSVIAGRKAEPLPFGYAPQLWEIKTPLAWLGLRILSMVAGMSVFSLYASIIACEVDKQRVKLGQILKQLPAITIQFLILAVILPFLLLIIFMPFLILATGLLALWDVLSGIVIMSGFVVMIWVSLFGAFTIHAMLMNRRNLLLAIWDSVRVVQWNVSATMLLFMSVVLVNFALQLVWELADAGSWLVVLGMMGNAFISTGLIMATFVFFKDRYRYWQEMREALLAELKRRQIEDGL
jgi:hypothetical protein